MTINDANTEQQELATALIQDMQTLKDNSCGECSQNICYHEILFSIVMGYKDSPRCCSCLATEVDKNTTELREQIYKHIQRRPCWKMGWHWCNTQEGFVEDVLPTCLWKNT